MKLLGCILLAGCVSYGAEIGVVEEIIAKVNGDIVTKGELAKTRQEMEAAMRQQGGANPLTLQKELNEREKDTLRDRIDQLLLVQKGKDLNINVDSEVSKYIANLQSEAKVADPEKFQEYVHNQTGVPFEDWKSEMKNSMLTQRVIRQEVGGKMNVKKEEMQKYYDEHKSEFVREERVFLREILVSTDGKDAAGKAASEKKAKDLYDRAKKGEKFPELARDNSDAVTAKSYGELGAFKKGELNPIIETQVWSQPKGFVTPPLRVDNGFMILKVEEHQKQGQAEMSEVENEITDKLFSPKMQPALREYLTKLRQNAFLEIKAGYVDTGAAPGQNTAWVDPATLKPETVTKAEVSNKAHHKKLLWAVPIPGTKAKDTSSSKK
ncbi:MAG: peptidylprolyl isomerase [Acidobacteriota bacterium]|nr:peptidylprolyl isomerase [Acidobacteriota bacterium]